MNALQMKIAIDAIIDRVKSARFDDNQYYMAINQAIIRTINDLTENIKQPKRYSFESSEMLVRDLYSLVAVPVTGVPTGTFIPNPTDIYYTTLLEITTQDNFTNAQVTNSVYYLPFGEKGIIDRNPFKKSKLDRTYFTEANNGFNLTIPPNTTAISYTLNYIKYPANVSIGNEGDKIGAGGTLVVGNDYYVYPDDNTRNAVSGGVTYYDGTLFTATNNLLTSGVVIPAGVVVNCDMPPVTHDELNRLASAIMLDSLENYSREGSLERQNNES